MRFKPFLFGIAFFVIIFVLAISASNGRAQAETCCASNWKLPLEAGSWLITQGDRDSCVSSHCAGSGPINEYALDIVSASEKTIKTMGAPVLAPADGTVIDEFWDGYGGGNVLKIEHGNGGFVTIYLHLSEYLVGKNVKVKQGDPVARIGNSTTEGRNMGAHLHLVVFKSKTERSGIKILSWDGNLNFNTGTKLTSTNGSGPISATRTPAPSVVEKPALARPENNSNWPQSTEITLVWNASTNASQYQVELWGGPYNLMIPCDWQGGASCRIGTMLPGTFSWHVRARNSSGRQSEWSDTWTFTIQGPTETPPPQPSRTPTPLPQAPGSPGLRDPVNGWGYSPSTDIQFSWNNVANASQYYLEYWGGPYGTLNSGWINDTSYRIGTMWPGTYNWHVKARGQNGVESNWSDTWTFVIAQPPTATLAIPTATSVPPTSIPPTPIPPTSTPVPQPGFVQLVDDLTLRTESGNWPPQAGQKLIAHIKIRNGGDLTLHIEHIGVRGRRNGSDFWDIGFWTVDLNGHDVWSLDPNNERPLVSGNYSFRISYSLDGVNWTEIGNEINFTVP